MGQPGGRCGVCLASAEDCLCDCWVQRPSCAQLSEQVDAQSDAVLLPDPANEGAVWDDNRSALRGPSEDSSGHRYLCFPGSVGLSRNVMSSCKTAQNRSFWTLTSGFGQGYLFFCLQPPWLGQCPGGQHAREKAR